MLSHLHFSDPVVFDVDSSSCTEEHGRGHGPTSATTTAHARGARPQRYPTGWSERWGIPLWQISAPWSGLFCPRRWMLVFQDSSSTSPEVVRAVLGAQRLCRPCPDRQNSEVARSGLSSPSSLHRVKEDGVLEHMA